MNKYIKFSPLLILLLLIIPVYAQVEDNTIPTWVKGVANFWVEDKIGDAEFIEALEFLINADIIRVANIQIVSDSVGETDFEKLFYESQEEIAHLEKQIKDILDESDRRSENESVDEVEILEEIMKEETIQSSIVVTTDKASYSEGEIIVVSGNVSIVIGSMPVTFHLFLEDRLVDIAQITIAHDGTYSHTVIAEGPLWKEPRDYLIKVSYGEGNIAETEFSYIPKSESFETTKIFEVNTGNQGTFDVEYTIKGGIVKDMIIDPSIFAIIVQIESTDEGTISLDLPREFIGAEKQDGKDDTFIILIDGIEVAYQETGGHSDSRIITINFEEGDSDIEIIGTYSITRDQQ